MFALTMIGAASAAVPTLIFASSDMLGARYSELPMAIDTETLTATIDGLLGDKPEFSLLTDVKTNHVVVFSTTGSVADFKPLVETAGSALGLPYASGMAIPESAAVIRTPAELEQVAAAGLPRLLVIEGADALAMVPMVNQISTDYVAVAMATPVSPRKLAAEDPLDPAAIAKVASHKAVAGEQVLMISPPILTGLLAGLLWLTIFFSGFCCLFQLQTQDRFEEKCLTINKEY